MQEAVPSKTCKWCYERIDARATSCRYCGQPQAGMGAWFARHHGHLSALPLVFMGIGILTFGWFMLLGIGLGDRGSDFAKHKDDIRIVSARMVFEDSNKGPMLYVLGGLKNEGDIPWQEVQLEAQFLDAGGKMIDVARYSDWRYSHTILPHDEAAYKIESSRDFPRERYASVKVFVRCAKDAKARW